MKRYLCAIGPVLAALGGCTESPSLHRVDEHPRIADLVANTPTVSKSDGIADSLPERLKLITRRLQAANEVSRFGALDTPSTHVFGDIADLAISGDTIYVLEPMAGEVRLFTIRGSHLATFGSAGLGPNELERPTALDLGSENIAVLERKGIKVFTVAERSLVLDRLIKPVGAEGGAAACMWLDSLFVIRPRGIRSDMQIHVFSSSRDAADSTDVLARFSGGYPFGDELLKGRLSRGPMACPKPGIVVIAYHDLPIVEAYTINGEAMWRAAITEFEPQRTIAGIDPDDGAPFIRASDKPARHRVQALTALPGGFVLLQVGRIDEKVEGSNNSVAVMESYIFDVDSGLGVFAGRNLPAILAASDSLLAGAASSSDLAPQITIWRY